MTAAAGAIKKAFSESDGDRCKAVDDLAGDFARMQLPAAFGDAIQMDATEYEVVSRSRMRELRVTAFGPEPAALVTWVEKANAALSEC